jgi:tetratricopeptide (TPR) repeat protein
MPGSLIQFPWKIGSLSAEDARAGAAGLLATPQKRRLEQASELRLEDPEQLLSVCELLRHLTEVEPARAREEAEFFYRFLETPRRSIGVFDERDYYMGELALVAGASCRVLAKRDEARRWFDLAEASFVLAHNASAHIARLAYQRLALRLEERDFEAVLQLAPRWFDCFSRLGLREDALKCRFLEAIALKETEQLEEAKQTLRQIKHDSQVEHFDRLAAIAGQNLFQIHAFLGEADQAMVEVSEAAPILGRLNNRVNLAKLQLGVGYLLRGQSRLAEALDAFRSAQRQFSEIEMHADVAATHLVLADILLDADQPAQAEWEIRAALPIIDRLNLVPEGIAALSLLRDSLRRRQIDRQALRSLNGYFEELGS